MLPLQLDLIAFKALLLPSLRNAIAGFELELVSTTVQSRASSYLLVSASETNRDKEHSSPECYCMMEVKFYRCSQSNFEVPK